MNHLTKNNTDTENESRRGIALLVTLGMLSVLMILAVTFSICMRTERMGAGNYRRSVNIRHMMYGAVAHAMHDLDNRIDNDGYPSEERGWWFNLADVYTNEADWAQHQDCFDDLMDFNDHQYLIPDAIVNSPNVLRFTNCVTTSTGDSYTYVVFDVSGMLDANFAGGGSRSTGVDVAEIQVGDLPGINLNRFKNHREDMLDEAFPPYETIASMMNPSPDGNPAWMTTNGSPYFVDYSLCPPGFYDSTNNEVNDAAIPLGSLTSLARAGTYLSDIGDCFNFNSQQRLVLLGNIIDYQDADFIPGNYTGDSTPRLNKGYVEPVPMINKVWFGLPSGPSPAVTMSLNTNATGQLQCKLSPSGYFYINLFYPFRDIEDTPTFYFNCSLEIVISYGVTELTLLGPLNLTEFQIDPDGVNAVNAAGYKAVTPSMATGILPGNLAFTTTVPGLNIGDPFTVSFRINDARVEWNNGGRVRVDEIPDPFDVELWSANASAGASIQVAAGRECVDPRLNWEDSDTQWPATTEASMEIENDATTTALATPGTDGDVWMKVKNARMNSVGELGAIFLGTQPWQTVRLYKHGPNEAHPVFNYFIAGTNTAARKGIVNPNTFDEEILGAAFKDMIVREEGEVRLDDSEALAIASEIMDNGPYLNIVDVQNNVTNWGELASGTLNALANPPACDLDREAIIGNSFGLFGTRQNIFYIVVRGERTTAVAMVWRDPYPNEDGNHPMFIRYLSIL